MNPAPRRPETCPDRQFHENPVSGRWTCGVVSRIIGGHEAERCYVTEEICEACCRHPLPAGPKLNPVVAARVFALIDELQSQMTSAAGEQARLQQTRQFAMQFLKADDVAPAASPEHENYAWQGHSCGLETGCTKNEAEREPLRLGLVGPSDGFGLAHQNRDIALHLELDRWLVRGQERPTLPGVRARLDVMSRDLSPLEIEAWLDGLDVVLFVERPGFTHLTRVARAMGIAVVCVPNWEWLCPSLPWLADVDLMLCPAKHTFRQLSDWKQRFGFEWNLACVPWPIDADRFPFRKRNVCRRFVYVHGSGGAMAQWCDGSQRRFRRKGLEVLLEAASLVPEIPLVIYAFPEDAASLPGNVELRFPPADNRLLYMDGDVCLQPSHWEGLGLPLLECQAAGLPLITTDAAPMNEHQPWRVLPARTEAARLTADLCIPAARIEPEDIAAVMKSVFGKRIGSESRRARRFIEREHSWQVVGPKIQETLRQAVIHRRRSPVPDVLSSSPTSGIKNA